jgi:hypothetical protein
VPLASVRRPGAWPATCAAPAANDAPRTVRRSADQRHLAQPLATDGSSECSRALCSDQLSHQRLGCARTKRVRCVRRVADVAAHDVAPERVSAFTVLMVFR